ncbi:hypothetical protein GJAV_G00157430 [Gymnothorax javanicus]|nr:hypothetical protein GJAV_G00157430 [Gymnothorax javanicus]
MSPGENSTGLNDTQIRSLSLVYVTSLSFSILGSLSVGVVSIRKRRHLHEQAWPLFQLALADFLASVMLLITSAMNLVSPTCLPQRIKICEHALPLAMAFYGISFLLILVYAFKSKTAVQGWRERTEGRDGQTEDSGKRWVGMVYAVVWIVPVAIFLLYVLTENLSEAILCPNLNETTTYKLMSNDWPAFCTSCILFLHIKSDTCPQVDRGHNLTAKVIFVISGILVLIFCTVIYCKVGSWYRRYKERGLVEGDGFDRRNLKGLHSAARNMILVIIICWTPALLLACLSFPLPQASLFPLYVIQAFTMSIQGFLDSIVYGWLRRNFREAALGERLPLLANVPRAFYDESLTM